MTNATRVIVGIVALSGSLLLTALVFTRHGPHTDLGAYGLSLGGLLAAVYALSVLFPARCNLGVKFVCILAALAAAFWSIEFFGGVAWYTLDKLARHYQDP